MFFIWSSVKQKSTKHFRVLAFPDISDLMCMNYFRVRRVKTLMLFLEGWLMWSEKESV